MCHYLLINEDDVYDLLNIRCDRRRFVWPQRACKHTHYNEMGIYNDRFYSSPVLCTLCRSVGLVISNTAKVFELAIFRDWWILALPTVVDRNKTESQNRKTESQNAKQNHKTQNRITKTKTESQNSKQNHKTQNRITKPQNRITKLKT